MTVPAPEGRPMIYMLEADLFGPAPAAVMSPGDLGIDEPKSTTVLKLGSDADGTASKKAPASGLLTEDGKHIDPAKLAEAVRTAGIIDAESSRYNPGSFPGLVDAYNDGHADGAQRQGKPWPPPNHSKVSDAR